MDIGGNTGTEAVELGSCRKYIHKGLTAKYTQVKTNIIIRTDLLVAEEGAPPEGCSTM